MMTVTLSVCESAISAWYNSPTNQKMDLKKIFQSYL